MGHFKLFKLKTEKCFLRSMDAVQFCLQAVAAVHWLQLSVGLRAENSRTSLG